MMQLLIKFFIFITITVSMYPCFGQNLSAYVKLVDSAQTAYFNGNYLQSGRLFNRAFLANGGRGRVEDRYNAACTWSKAQVPDSAFEQLFRIAKFGNYRAADEAQHDTDLTTLHTDARWTEFISLVRQNSAKELLKTVSPLQLVLSQMLERDQVARKKLSLQESNVGLEASGSPTHIALSKEDAVNQTILDSLLSKGILDTAQLSSNDLLAVFLVMQHAPNSKHQYYLSVADRLRKSGRFADSYYAYMVDRNLVLNKQNQVYGTQFYTDSKDGVRRLYPTKHFEDVDLKRQQVGLEPIRLYLSSNNIVNP